MLVPFLLDFAFIKYMWATLRKKGSGGAKLVRYTAFPIQMHNYHLLRLFAMKNNKDLIVEEESDLDYSESNSADSYSSESGTDSGYGSMSVDSS